MPKKKTLQKQNLLLRDIPRVSIKHNDLEEVNPSNFFKDPSKVALALFQALIENDTKAFIDILDAYLDVNRTVVAKKSLLARSTIQQAFSGGNPTLKTIAKIIHTAVDKDTSEWFKLRKH